MQCTVYTVHCIVYSVQCTMYSEYYITYTIEVPTVKIGYVIVLRTV